MELPRDGVEFAHITFDEVPYAATVQASIDRVNWTDLNITNLQATYLLRGPDSTSTDGALVQSSGTTLWVRLADSPEVIIRAAGKINLY